MQRTKGAAGERELCAHLTRDLDTPVTRNIGQARDGGDDITVAGLCIEAKRRKGIAALRFMEQAKDAAAEKGVKAQGATPIPVVALREDGDTEWYMLISYTDFMQLAGPTLRARLDRGKN